MANRLKDLMKSQEVASPLNRALQMNEQLEGMREKNVILYDQNKELTRKNREIMREREGLVQLVTNLNQELDDLRKTYMAKEKRLQQELRNMQISWDSLYEEHRAAEERRERELLAKNEKLEDKSSQQAQLLQSAVKKTPKLGMVVSPMEKKLHELEDENKKLKSKVVQLQTKYREEKYKNENEVKESDSLSTTDSDSVSSTENPISAGGNLLAGFKNRNLARRQNNNNSRPPKFAQSTKGLWGRLNNRNMKEPAALEFPGINLAFSRDD
mmetsp:Transcript_11657/g.29514  ORF Transcript_11657/g.29514 Transcript_11657/m.29514 type:complete len:270 (-) Transcript_11657:509-1318(-)|eukprot:CAMPEP_0116086844 /NCGR_PEP_ID=MMETSP0327-20121206/5064_1 /TAXON_ID=44447 /ORGANISM="Pseudo-nitzschia delicatissima, Strain B596" /LENGTH=269 /DNA_ID=CAMNT_0003577907 /DNA_START=209 /DNA_END=1018 /DNA_ORIENTATION=-